MSKEIHIMKEFPENYASYVRVCKKIDDKIVIMLYP